MHTENVQAKGRQLSAGVSKAAILSLRPPRGPGLLLTFTCAVIGIGTAFIQSVGYLNNQVALATIVCLAIVAGLGASNVFHPILEVRLEHDALIVRDPWAVRRYLWHDIPEPFYVLAGKSGTKVTFTWYSGATVKRAFLCPECLRISAESLAALLNDRWKQGSRFTDTSTMGAELGEATSNTIVER